MKNLGKINICSRVDLWVCDEGYRFTVGNHKPKDDNDLQSWKSWSTSWQPYKSDNIEAKVLKFLDQLPERFKITKMYQSIHFTE